MQYLDGRRAEAASPWARLLRNDDRLTWSVAEAADLLGISRTSADEAAHRGELPGQGDRPPHARPARGAAAPAR